MKKNSKKLLLWMWSEEEESQRWISGNVLPLLLPDLSSSGRRSLISLLKQKKLIFLENIDGETKLSLTSHGYRAVSEAFPVLSQARRDWTGQWSLLLFLEAPKTDANFRYLRSLLMGLGSQSLSRGCYMYPGNFPNDFIDTCDELYKGHVTLFTVSKWQFGDERSIAVKNFGLQDVVETLSGISREIDSLLGAKKAGKNFSDRDKVKIFMVFDRLVGVVDSDMGIARRYFSSVVGSAQLLSRLQSLI